VILRRLSLENYRKYRKTELDFPLGLIAVVGRNGMGKTSLVEAVAFALYGKTASRDDLRSCISDWCGPGDTCVVELEFEMGGTPYRILRRVRAVQGAQAHQAELYEGAGVEPVATSVKAVEDHVRRVLGMDYVTFTRSVFSKQKEVNTLSTADPAERQAAIRRMVGIEAVSDAVALVRRDARELERTIEGARRAIEALPERQAEAAKARAALKPAREAAAVKQRIAAAAKVQGDRTRAALNKLKVKRTKDETLQKQQATVSAQLDGASRHKRSLEQELSDYEQRRDQLAELAPQEKRFGEVTRLKERLDKASGKHEEKVQIENELPGLRKEVEKSTAQVKALADARARMSQASKDDRAARTAARSADTKLKELQRARGQAKQHIGGPTSQCERLRKSLTEIRKEGSDGKCPTCLRPLGEEHEKIVDHLQQELAEYEEARRRAERELADIEQQLDDWTRKQIAADGQVEKATRAVQAAKLRQQALATARAKLMDAKRLLRQREARANQLATVDYDEARHETVTREHAELSKLHDQAEKLREAVGRIPKLKKKLADTVRQIAKATAELARTERARARVGFDARQYAAADTANDDAQDERQEAAVAATEAAGVLKQVTRDLEVARQIVKDLLRQKALIERDEEKGRYLTRLEQLLKDFRDQLASRFRPELAAFASTLLDQVTGGRYPRIEFDEYFNISLEDNGVPYPLKRFSGGEEDLANLCLRLAISQVVSQRHATSGSSLVVLDEVFASQDTERRERILQALLKLQETFQQVILISHMDDIHDRVPNVLRISENAAREGEAEWMSG
jgi:exonuclease SbcC